MSFTINGTTGINLGTEPFTGQLPDANAPSGSVIQVVQALLTTQTSSSSSSFVTSGLSASITPSSSSNKILVMVNGGKNYTPVNARTDCTLYRNGSEIGSNSRWTVSEAGSGIVGANHSFCYLDSPSSASSVTYTAYYRSAGAAGTVYFCDAPNACGAVTMTLMEITA